MVTLETAIVQQRIIDLRLFDDRLYYTGVCLQATRQLVVIVNYDSEQKQFDGFTIFRNADFEQYRVCSKKETPLRINNLHEFSERYPQQRLRTFYSWLKYLQGRGLFAFYTGQDFESYFVGQIIAVNRKQVRVRGMDKKGTWIGYKTFDIAAIDFFSFDTTYEKRLQQKIR